MAKIDFDLDGVQISEYLPIEPGEYEAIIVESEDLPTKSGGRYVRFKCQICSGKHINRTLLDNLNLWNKSETASQIARSTLKEICLAVGVPNPKDTAELHGKKLKVVVAIEKRDDNGEMRNVIKRYLPILSQPVVASSAEGGRKPW